MFVDPAGPFRDAARTKMTRVTQAVLVAILLTVPVRRYEKACSAESVEFAGTAA